MDINKEREAFEESFKIKWEIGHYILKMVKFIEDSQDYAPVNAVKQMSDEYYWVLALNTGWWAWQAAKAQAVPKWVSVEDRLPPCDFEFCETGEHVSNVVLIHSAATYGFNMGMGHVNEDGVWNAYSGEHDFMNVLMVTHWMPLPDAPQEPTND